MVWRLGLAGSPIDHSLSPLLHTSVYELQQWEWEYRLHPCCTDGEFATLLQSMRTGDACAPSLGLNVTTPFKRLAARMVDELDGQARRCGVVNTIVVRRQAGKRLLVGAETDGVGMVSALQRAGIGLSGARVVLCGTGALAAAGVVCLVEQGASVHLVGRTPGALERIVDTLELPRKQVSFGGYDEQAQVVRGADILINATTVGMSVDDLSLIDTTLLHRGQTVLDAVYRAGDTQLISQARSCGCATIDGVDLLVEQAIPALELWAREAGEHVSDAFAQTARLCMRAALSANRRASGTGAADGAGEVLGIGAEAAHRTDVGAASRPR